MRDMSTIKKNVQLGPAVILWSLIILIFLIFAFTSKSFFSYINLSSMLRNMSWIFIIAAGETIVLLTGNLDISIGGVIALVAVVTAKLYDRGLNIVLVMFIAILIGLTVGVTNGLLVTRIKLLPLLTTLGMLSITSGLAYVISNGLSILIMEDVLGYLGRGNIWKIPFPIIIALVILILFTIILRYSKFGRKIYITGSNSLAAKLSGISTGNIVIVAYIICGLCTALGSLILTSTTAVGMPQHGMNQMLTIIAAVILGGVPLSGGKGNVIGTLAAVLLLALIFNGLTQLNIQSYYIRIVQGLILIVAVAIYQIRELREE